MDTVKTSQSPSVEDGSKPRFGLHIERAPVTLSEEEREFLASWLGVTEEEEEALVQRVEAFHAQATQVYDYPCLYRYGYAKPAIQLHPHWPALFSQAQAQAQSGFHLVDVGCCMGTDLRMAAHLGLPLASLRGVELQPDFLRLGHEFFADGHREEVCRMFVAGDVLHDHFFESPAARALPVGQVDALYCGSILHLFDQAQLERLLDVVYTCLRPGGVFFGRTTGLPQPQRVTHYGLTRFLHNVDSLTHLLSARFGCPAHVGEGSPSSSLSSLPWKASAEGHSQSRIHMHFSVTKMG